MSKAKVLVIDDEPIVLDFLTQALERLNHEPVPASTGERAIELIEKDELKLYHIFDYCQTKKNKKEGGCGHH